ncbi:unnamed protein product [Acanthoscelides obtectus]|uniref:Uncharacterized protein n=1 Tax=Acanthoscelides obtectus TaxID=200917 RepID=A0A9P0KPR7_ACAOB|nr:unnamed protein product [Acanthoscelides obtectus]CAK1651993.1 hypothetical protein AOBTE_LOCUS17596 [Acanthoscelides obtectus]
MPAATECLYSPLRVSISLSLVLYLLLLRTRFIACMWINAHNSKIIDFCQRTMDGNKSMES